jgi:hypothetical protein
VHVAHFTQVYFGNWLRDYSQAVDVGTVKYVSAEAIRILLWILGFMSFGYGTGEFEVTTERLGCYRPEEHIDNPKDYAENEDARQYDRRLRGPVDERRELSVNPDTGLKNYIASENLGIDTSAGLVRNLLGRAIDMGRRYNRSKNNKELYEALRLIGTASHCLEDYAAHSNYVELALIEMGERDIFPHVGRNTAIRLRGARSEVYPIVTGTFGGVDFLHSVCGEFSDKTTQSEIAELEDALNDAGNTDGSVIRDLLSKIPSGLFGGKDEAGKVDQLQQNAQAHQMQNTRISPRQPEEWTRYLQDVQKQIYPIIEWHDEVMQGLTQTIEKLPILPDLIENVQEEINKFVFTLLAPYVVPIIRQISNELETGSSEIIGSSKAQQHVVFRDDRSTDPTHSMLSKDHFSNVLNEPAGRVASATVKWVIPQIVEAWDNERADIPRTLDRIINGVLHHPALRDQGGDASEGRRIMFGVVEKWWSEKDSREKDGLRRQLSRRGVENGDNHKEGVHDHGHGSYRPKGQRIGIAGVTSGSGGSGGSGNYPISDAVSAVEDLVSGGQGGQSHPSQGGYGRQSGGGNQMADDFGKKAGEAAGGGLLGGLVSGIASAVGADMLGGGLDDKKDVYKKESYGRDGSHTQTFTQVGQSGDRYGQAQYTRTEQPSGGRTEEYSRYEQRSSGGATYHHEERDQRGNYREETQTYGSSRRNDDDRRQHGSSGGYGSSRRDDDDDNRSAGRRQEHGSSGYGGSRRDDDDNRSSGYGRTQEYGSSTGYGSSGRQEYGSSTTSGSGSGRRDDNSSYGSGRQEYGSSNAGGFGSSRRDDDDNRGSYGRSEGHSSGGYGRQEERSSGYGSSRRDDNDGYGSSGGFGQSQQSYGGSGGYGQQQSYDSSGGYGQQESYGRSEGYGAQQGSHRRRDDDDDDDRRGGYGRRDDDNNGYGHNQSQGGYGSSGGYDNDSGYGGRRY